MTKHSDKILTKITDFYLNSRDFNGMCLKELQKSIKISEEKLIIELIPLIKEGKISINFGDRHVNPHIKAFDPEPASEQIAKFDKCNFHNTCAYPEKPYLKTIVNVQEYMHRPFTLKLALGDAQLSYLSFDLMVLEVYRNDPRYYYSTDDIHGWISVSDKYFESEEMPKSDQIVLESFSFSYDRSLNRAVAVFLVYLSRLSPEHQQIWMAKLVHGEFTLHPEYALSSSGCWPENESIFTAFITELQIINEMCDAMGKPHLFRDDFKDRDKPRGFSFLIRQTAKEFQDFILILDKMISDNINKDFFKGDIELEEDIVREDRKIQVIQKGTIRLLNEWIKTRFRTDDPQPIIEMIKCFKKIRELRQRPAHALDDNEFNQEIFKKQRELVVDAYSSIRLLRLLFANHPKCKEIKVPNWLYKGKISPY